MSRKMLAAGLIAGLSCCLPSVPAIAQTPEAPLKIGGAVRSNLFYKTWEDAAFSQARYGNWAFDTLRLTADSHYQNIRFSSEYRLYPGYQFLRYGWAGYTFADHLELQAGVHKVPFGLLPYASNNWFLSLPYYLGFEDDYDAGLKLIAPFAGWGIPLEAQLAFYKNDEGSFTGRSLDSARWSYDVVRSSPGELAGAGLGSLQANRETNQGNLRLAHSLAHGAWGTTELGVSGQYGGLYNDLTGRNGDRWATAAHVDGNYWNRLNIKLQVMRYAFRPENPTNQDPDVVTMGAYDAPYKVAARANVYGLGLGYRIPVSWGPISQVMLYDDFSSLQKEPASFAPSHMNVLGASVTAGPMIAYLEAVSGLNHPWVGSDYGRALAEGSPDARWETRFNLNVGYYF